MFNRDFVSFIVTSSVMILWVEFVKLLGAKANFSSNVRRKIMHILTGPIFLFMWPLFSRENGRLYACCVPLIMTFKFYLIGTGILKDEDAVRSMSRTGNPRELLAGPVYYGIVFVLNTWLNWMDIRGILIICCICFGDGFAEVVGRRFGRKKIFWSPSKSWVGSLAFFFASVILTNILLLMIINMFESFIIIEFNWGLFCRVVNSAFTSTMAESLPLDEVDNISIFLTISLTDWLFTRFF